MEPSVRAVNTLQLSDALVTLGIISDLARPMAGVAGVP